MMTRQSKASDRVYMRRWHDLTRPAPQPLPQEAPELPPLGALIADDDGSRVCCHVCGIWLPTLHRHARLVHGLSSDDYRERYGLARGLSLEAPATLAKRRANALARGQGQIGAAVLREVHDTRHITGHDRRLSSRILQSQATRQEVPERPPGRASRPSSVERERRLGELERMISERPGLPLPALMEALGVEHERTIYKYVSALVVRGVRIRHLPAGGYEVERR